MIHSCSSAFILFSFLFFEGEGRCPQPLFVCYSTRLSLQSEITPQRFGTQNEKKYIWETQKSFKICASFLDVNYSFHQSSQERQKWL